MIARSRWPKSLVTGSALKVEPGPAAVAGRAAASHAGPSAEVERLRGGGGGRGFVLLALLALLLQRGAAG